MNGKGAKKQDTPQRPGGFADLLAQLDETEPTMEEPDCSHGRPSVKRKLTVDSTAASHSSSTKKKRRKKLLDDL